MHEFNKQALTVEEMYGDWDYEAAEALLERSLEPRRSLMIFDTVASLGTGSGDHTLDIGGRNGFHALIMAERFGCRVTVVDPAPANIADGEAAIVDHEYGHLVDMKLGVIENIPARDDAFDLVFSRDMMSHVPDLEAGFTECARVLRPGGAMVIHANFNTDLMEPQESELLHGTTASVAMNADPQFFESAFGQAGLTVAGLQVIGSEWYEANQEAGHSPNYALQVSKLRRGRDRYVEELGDVAYRSMLGNALWGTYLLIGKLEARLYVLRSPGD